MASEACGVTLNEAFRRLVLQGRVPAAGSTAIAQQIEQITRRRSRPHVLVVGGHGVGKSTQIDEALQRLHSTDSVEVELSLASVMANVQSGQTFLGELKRALESLTPTNGNTYLVIRDLSLLVQTSGENRGAAFALIREFLQRRNSEGHRTVLITETTYDVFNNLPKDFQDFFSVVRMESGSADKPNTTVIIREVARRHNIQISDEAIAHAIRRGDPLSLPGSAIDLIEAAQAIVEGRNAPTSDVNAVQRARAELQRLNSEREDLQRDINVYQGKIDRNESISPAARASFRASQTRVREIDQEIAKRNQIILANSGREITKELIEEVWIEMQSGTARRVAQQFDSPEFREQLQRAEAWFAERLIDQPEAVKMLAEVAVRVQSRIRDPNAPVAVLRFDGPSSSGKTYALKLLGEFVFGDKYALMHLFGESLSERHTVSSLWGAPVGYEGSEQGGQIPNRLQERPFSIIFLDEGEKSHVDVRQSFLTPMRDGQTTDRRGNRVDASNAIFAEASNAGSALIERIIRENPGNAEILNDPGFMSEFRREIMRMHGYTPEYLNRQQDGWVIFRPITRSGVIRIAPLRIKELAERMQDGEQVRLEVDQAAVEFIGTFGYRPELGAVNVQQAISRLLERPIDNHLFLPVNPRSAYRGGNVKVTAIYPEGTDLNGETKPQPIGLEYVLLSSDGESVLGRLSLRQSSYSTSVYEFVDSNGRVVKTLTSFVVPSASAVKPVSEGQGNGAMADTPIDADPEIFPLPATSVEEVRAQSERTIQEALDAIGMSLRDSERSLNRNLSSLPIQFSDGLRDWVAQFRYHPQRNLQRGWGEFGHVQKNVEEILIPALGTVIKDLSGAPSKLEVGVLEPQASLGLPNGGLSFKIIDSDNEVLGEYRLVFDRNSTGGWSYRVEGPGSYNLGMNFLPVAGSISIEEARMAVPAALGTAVARLPQGLNVEVQDSFREFIAARGREHSVGSGYISSNVSLHLERPIVALMRMPELANAAKVEVIYRAPDQPGTINRSFGEVFYRFRDSQGNILKDVIGNLHSTDGSDNSPPGLAGTNGMLLQIPPPAPSTSSLFAPGTSIIGPGFPLPQ